MTDKATATAQPSNDPAATNAAETTTENTSTDTSASPGTAQDDDALFREYADKANKRLEANDSAIATEIVGTADNDDDDPPPKKDEPTESNQETATKVAVSTSEPAKDGAATDKAAATTDASKEAKPAASAQQEPTDEELLAQVPEAQRERFASRLKAARDSTAALVEKDKEIQRVRSELGRVRATAAKPAAPKPQAVPPEEQAAWKKLEEKYPDVAKGIKGFFKMQGGDPENTKELLQFVAQKRAETEYEELSAAVETAHPKWVETVRTSEFKAWIKAQPEKVKAWADSDAPEDAMLLLDRYTGKGAHRPPDPAAEAAAAEAAQRDEKAAKDAAALINRRNLQRDGAATPDRTKGGAQPNTELDPNGEEALWKFYAQQANARLARFGA